MTLLSIGKLKDLEGNSGENIIEVLTGKYFIILLFVWGLQSYYIKIMYILIYLYTYVQ